MESHADFGLILSKPRTKQECHDSGILNDFQFEELEKLAQNPVLLEALEKVLCHEIVSEGVFNNKVPFDAGQNFILSYVQGIGGVINNERLGEDVRALFWGILRLKEGIKTIKAFNEPEKVSNNDKNPAI